MCSVGKIIYITDTIPLFYFSMVKSYQNKLLFFLLLNLFLQYTAYSQSYLGFREGNFSGVLGVSYQPASILDYPSKFDVSIFSTSAFVDNNIADFKRENPFLNLNTTIFKGNVLKHSDTRFAFGETEQSILAFMWQFKEGHAISVVPKVRSVISAQNISPDFVNFLIEPTSDTKFGQVADLFFNNQEGQVYAMSWNELALTYSSELYKDKFRKLTMGITPKLLYSNAAMYVDLEELSFNSPLDSEDEIIEIKGKYGVSKHLGDYQRSDWKWKPEGDFGFALDIGFRYEKSSTHFSSPTYDGARGRVYHPRHFFYDYRLDFTILDLGRLSFQENENGVQIDGIRLGQEFSPAEIRGKIRRVRSLGQLSDSLSTLVNTSSNSGAFSIALPTTINFNIDKNLNNGIYFNGGIHLPLALYPSDFKLSPPANVTASLRWESYLLGVYWPNYLNINGHFTTGLALRIGPLILGIQDVQPFLFKERMKTAGAYAALKFFIFPKKNDLSLPCFNRK